MYTIATIFTFPKGEELYFYGGLEVSFIMAGRGYQSREAHIMPLRKQKECVCAPGLFFPFYSIQVPACEMLMPEFRESLSPLVNPL
jgi:hypothetical protein